MWWQGFPGSSGCSATLKERLSGDSFIRKSTTRSLETSKVTSSPTVINWQSIFQSSYMYIFTNSPESSLFKVTDDIERKRLLNCAPSVLFSELWGSLLYTSDRWVGRLLQSCVITVPCTLKFLIFTTSIIHQAVAEKAAVSYTTTALLDFLAVGQFKYFIKEYHDEMIRLKAQHPRLGNFDNSKN